MALRVVAINAYRSALKRIAMNCTDKSNMVLKAMISTDVREKIDKMVSSNKVVVFMKGDPEAPRCGFSNAVVQVFRMHGVEYDSHDVLSNETLRKAIKDYTCWPTIPQVFINGEFVGGCDILLEKHQNGELIEDLKKIGIKSALIDKENKEKDLSADEK